MKYGEILQNLKEALAVRVLGQKAFRITIGDLLGISVSMVSRKLAGETPFTAQEISVLCEAFDIPVYEIFKGHKDSIWQPLQLALTDLTENEDATRQVFDWSVDMFSYAAQSDYSTFYITCNTFPDLLNPTFEGVARFSALQWLFLNKGIDSLLPLSRVMEIAETKPLMDKYISSIHSLKRSVYLVSYKILENYIAEIRKFYQLGYITKEDILLFIPELEAVLALFEKVCITGRLENGKEMEIYCTDFFLPSDMYILESEKINFGIFHPNPINPVITKSSDVCHTMTKWFNSWRRSSTLISQSGTHLRQQFMDVQYRVLGEFKAEMAAVPPL
ncbi:MAG: hypothetical protein LUE93_01325 [Bacteroides sp.]|nr:hypothetical protein [Bacteroides sp.]